MHHPTDRIAHTTAFVIPVVEHWQEREIAQWVNHMNDRSDDPSHHERTPLPRSYIDLNKWQMSLCNNSSDNICTSDHCHIYAPITSFVTFTRNTFDLAITLIWCNATCRVYSLKHTRNSHNYSTCRNSFKSAAMMMMMMMMMTMICK